jgi:integrase/recombinase XerD
MQIVCTLLPLSINKIKKSDMKGKEKPDYSTGIYLDTRRSEKEGLYPVKLRVTYKRKSRLYKTPFYLTEIEFGKVMGKKPRDEYKDKRQEFARIENHATNIIKSLRSFSFEVFRRRLFANTGDQGNIFSAFKEYIAELDEKDRIGNSSIYTAAMHSLSKFHPGVTLNFHEITPSFLKRYEKWMIEKGHSVTTVAIYARCIRRLYNRAIRDSHAKFEEYPFGREADQYQIPESRNIKKALPLDDIRKIFTYKPKDSDIEAYSRDLWIFSYLCNGINMKDICLLKYSDLTNDSIIFRRAKTIQTKKKNKSIEVLRTHKINEIIKKWGQKPAEPKNYIFPVLVENLNSKQQQGRIRQVTKQVNKYIRRITESLKIKSDVTTYTARHSFATILKRAGVNISYISDALGHSDLKTTQGYLGSFENEEKKKIAAHLINFSKKQRVTK